MRANYPSETRNSLKLFLFMGIRLWRLVRSNLRTPPMTFGVGIVESDPTPSALNLDIRGLAGRRLQPGIFAVAPRIAMIEDTRPVVSSSCHRRLRAMNRISFRSRFAVTVTPASVNTSRRSCPDLYTRAAAVYPARRHTDSRAESPQESVYNWERKKATPRKEQAAAIAALRSLGKEKRVNAWTPPHGRQNARRKARAFADLGCSFQLRLLPYCLFECL